MKLSEQIANSCCGVLADKQEMINKAVQLETIIEDAQRVIKFAKLKMMEIDDE
tara:strand:+ start:836 stop:994 length:159 start_codon:yes stop_codon:yes gene_type:complete